MSRVRAMNNHQGRYCPVALALMAALWPQAGWSESYFNPAFLSDDTANVALYLDALSPEVAFAMRCANA